MPGRVLEVLFRRPLQLLLLIVFLPVISVAIVYVAIPRSYQSSASLWAFRRYAVIGLTGPETDLTSTPAQTQATALTEMLQSRNFDLTIASDSHLASTLSADVLADHQLRDDTLSSDISQHVLVAGQGYNLFTITYTNKNPQIAQQVVQAVIQNFEKQSQQFTIGEAQQLLGTYQAELIKAKQDVQTAIAAESNYITRHRNLTPASLSADPHYNLLHTQTQQTQASEANIQTNIASINDQLNSQGNGANSLFKTLDAPNAQGLSRTKTYLIGGGVGLGVALIACLLYIVLAVRRDRTVHSLLDLEQITALPVVMQLPQLNNTTMSLLLESALHGDTW